MSIICECCLPTAPNSLWWFRIWIPTLAMSLLCVSMWTRCRAPGVLFFTTRRCQQVINYCNIILLWLCCFLCILPFPTRIIAYLLVVLFIVSVISLRAAPSQPPAGLRVTLIEDDIALVSWREPTEPNVVVTRYTILYASQKAWMAGRWQILQREGE